MSASPNRAWILAALLVGVVYFLIGRGFALSADHVRAWRLAAWVVSKVQGKMVISFSSLKNRIVNGYLSLLSLGFLTLATTAVEPFGCRDGRT